MERKIVIELDGGQHLSQQLADQRRTEYLNKLGYCVLRFWDHEALVETEAVLEQTLASAENPHPNPLPPWRGRNPKT